jgi:hypothetical protein
MKILPAEAELFHTDRQTDGQTDMKKQQSVFAILQTRLKFTG